MVPTNTPRDQLSSGFWLVKQVNATKAEDSFSACCNGCYICSVYNLCWLVCASSSTLKSRFLLRNTVVVLL
jgi:hypothetical protein